MRRLDRAAVPSPPCLANYLPGRDKWDDVNNEDRIQIRVRLEQMQGRRCAYCEGALDALGQHIEHFRRKHHFQALTFEWSNLYWSCDQKDSCGHYKDHGAGRMTLGTLSNRVLTIRIHFFDSVRMERLAFAMAFRRQMCTGQKKLYVSSTLTRNGAV